MISASRLEMHFVAMAAVGAVVGVGVAQKAEAAIVYSGAVNLPIAPTTNGLYLNVVTGQINEPGNGSGSAVPGWDVNPYSSSSLTLFNPSTPSGGVYATVGGSFNLTVGTLIDGASTYSSGNFTPGNLNSDDNYVGFRFQNEALGNQVEYGWLRIHLGASLTDPARAVIGYAYDNTGAGIAAGAGVPAPSAGMALLALGGAGLLGRRRK